MNRLSYAILFATAIAAAVLAGALRAPPIEAQSQPGRPVFEVASVKEHASYDRNRGFQTLPGGKLHLVNLPLQQIILLAYDLPFQGPARLSGGPEWVQTSRFDIDATAEKDLITSATPAKIGEAKIRLMLQSLLADRFKLVLKREMKDSPIYALVVGKNGIKLEKSAIQEKDCSTGLSFGDGVSCHVLNGGQGRGLHGQAVTVGDIALFVSNWSDRPIIDKTGNNTLFKVDTDGWTPLQAGQGPPRNDEEAAAITSSSRPTMFSIFDQMGLRLEARRAPLEMFFIESVQKPSEN